MGEGERKNASVGFRSFGIYERVLWLPSPIGWERVRVRVLLAYPNGFNKPRLRLLYRTDGLRYGGIRNLSI
jgi:hypothetical protein